MEIDKIYRKFDRNAKNYDNFAMLHIKIAEYLCNLVNQNTNSHCKICDLGCGTGILTEKILKTFSNANIDCVDISKVSLEILQCKNYKNVNIISNNIINVDINKYDILFSSMSLQWLPDLSEFLTKISKKQSFYFAIPIENSLSELRNSLINLGLNNSIMNFPESSDILQIFQNYNIKYEISTFFIEMELRNCIEYVRKIGASYSDIRSKISIVKKLLENNINSAISYQVLFIYRE